MEKITSVLKNKYFWIILLMVIGYLGIVIIVGTKKQSGYLIISNIDSFKFSTNDECKRITKEELLKENKSNFIVFEDNKKSGEYRLDYINKWNFFDINNKWQEIDSDFIAASPETDLDMKEFTTREMNSDELALLKKELNENGIDYYTSLSQNEVLEYDFDKNKKIDKIIIASNITDETEDEKLFTIVLGIIKNKTRVINISINDQYENFDAPTYNLKGIINVFNNKKDYLIINKGYFSEAGESESYIYKINGSRFENIIAN